MNNPKTMMKAGMISLFVCVAALRGMAAEPEWMTDVPAAEAKAKAEHKMVLLDFTGSDWCGWCIKFKKEVYSTPEFSEYAAKNLILVEIDFPHDKPQGAELKAANKELQAKYRVQGFPTTLVLDGDGKKLKEWVGYQKGGATAFIAQLNKLKKS